MLNMVASTTSLSKGGIALVKKLASRKGISPILATLLLIVIAVGAVIITYAWVITFTTTQTTTAGKLIKYDSQVIDAASNMVTVYVRNWGTEDVTLDKVYIDAVDHTDSVTSPAGFPTAGASLSVDAVIKITVNGTDAGLDFSAGSTYKVKVAGPGVEWEDSVRAS
jgi:flagellin-like protein